MPVNAADLTFFSAANVPEDDTSTAGGARSSTSRPELTQLTANAVIAAVSDGADTRTLTVTGRLASGAIDTEALVLTGAVEVVGAKTFERILKLELSAGDAARTVTVRQGAGGATRATLTPNHTKRHIFFQRSASEAASVERFEKCFGHNASGTNALNSATVKLTADPASRIRIGLEAAKDGTQSVANRKTVPGSVTFVDDGVAQNVPGGNLGVGEAIGVWVEQDLLASDTAKKDTFTLELAGTTT